MSADGFVLFWCVMITSAVNKSWPDDISLEERHQESGLPIPCVIRTSKIATIEVEAANKIGRLPPDIYAEVRARLSHHLGF